MKKYHLNSLKMILIYKETMNKSTEEITKTKQKKRDQTN